MPGVALSFLPMFVSGRTLSVTTPLQNVGAWMSVIGASVTVLAALVAGIWAYFKFLKGRTYRPRLEVTLYGQWLQVNDRPLLTIRVSVKNIGQADVHLLQYGTGLKVRRLASDQQVPPDVMSWEAVTATPTYEILKDHIWFEPSEVVGDELLVDLDVKHPVVVLLESRLVCKWRWGRHNIAILTRKILAPEGSAWTEQSGI